MGQARLTHQSAGAWRIVAHAEDRSTGTKLDRPRLSHALELASERKIDLLLVYRVDRLSRKVRQLAQLAEELDRLGVALRSATEPFDTGSAAGRMMLQMLGVFAEFEHATIVDRVSAGIERRAKEGKWATGRLPFGYRRNDVKEVVADERTAPIVRRIFDLYTSGRLGTAAIARQLADHQAPAPRSGWQAAIVQLVLQNEAYLGRVLWRGESLPGLTNHSSTSSASSAHKASCANAAKTWRCDAAIPATPPLWAGARRPLPPRLRRHERTRERRPLPLLRLLRPTKTRPQSMRRRTHPRLTRSRRHPPTRQPLPRRHPDPRRAQSGECESPTSSAGAQGAAAGDREEARRAERALARYYTAFEDGGLDATRFEARVSALEARLDALRGQDADLARQLAPSHPRFVHCQVQWAELVSAQTRR